MAGFIPSPNTIRVLVHWTLHGRPQLNTLNAEYLLAGPLSPNIAQNIFAPAAAALSSTGYVAILAATTTLAGIGVVDLRSPNNPEIESTGDAVAGTGIGSPLPDSSSLVLTERTAFTGRSFRGRIYTLGWTSVAINADGTASSSAAAAAVAWYQALQAAMAAQSATLAILSPALPERPAHDGTTLPPKPFAITPVTVIEARDLIFDSNRRRADQLHR